MSHKAYIKRRLGDLEHPIFIRNLSIATARRYKEGKIQGKVARNAEVLSSEIASS